MGRCCVYSLRMASTRHELFLLVREADGSVGEGLADWSHKGQHQQHRQFPATVDGHVINHAALAREAQQQQK